MGKRITWQPQPGHGRLQGLKREELPESIFAFPKQRKEPMTDATHVRNALARFDQVAGASDKDREIAFANIKKAAEYYGVQVAETDWRELGKKPHTKNMAQAQRATSKKGH
jgi:hypothetical protein